MTELTDLLTQALALSKLAERDLDGAQLKSTIASVFDPSAGGCEPACASDIAIGIQDILDRDERHPEISFTWLNLCNALDQLVLDGVLSRDRMTAMYGWHDQ